MRPGVFPSRRRGRTGSACYDAVVPRTGTHNHRCSWVAACAGTTRIDLPEAGHTQSRSRRRGYALDPGTAIIAIDQLIVVAQQARREPSTIQPLPALSIILSPVLYGTLSRIRRISCFAVVRNDLALPINMEPIFALLSASENCSAALTMLS